MNGPFKLSLKATRKNHLGHFLKIGKSRPGLKSNKLKLGVRADWNPVVLHAPPGDSKCVARVETLWTRCSLTAFSG